MPVLHISEDHEGDSYMKMRRYTGGMKKDLFQYKNFLV